MTFLLTLALVLSVPLPDAPGPGATGPEGPPQKIQPIGVRASSHLPDWKSYTFRPENLIDGRVDTSWQPAKSKGKNPNYGIGQWFEVDLGATYHVTAIQIAHGLQLEDKLGDLFCRNNRVSSALILFDDGSFIRHTVGATERLSRDEHFYGLDSSYKTQPRDGARTRFVRFLVQQVEVPVDWPDIAVAEIEVFGRPSAPLAAPTDAPIACGSAGFVPFIRAIIDYCAPLDGKERRDAQCMLYIDSMFDCRTVVGYEGVDPDEEQPSGPIAESEFIFEVFPPIIGAASSRRLEYRFRTDREVFRTLVFERPDGGAWRLTAINCIGDYVCSGVYELPFSSNAWENPCWKKLGKKPPAKSPGW
jgi:hypothetical protein